MVYARVQISHPNSLKYLFCSRSTNKNRNFDTKHISVAVFPFAYKPGFHEACAFALLAAPGQNDDLPLICLTLPGKRGVRLVCKRRQGTRSRFDLETASSLQVLRSAGFTACFCYVLRKFYQIKIYEIVALG